MPELCLVTICMGRLEHLKRSLPAALAQPASEWVVVDYSCPDKCGDWVERHYPAVKVVRVPGEASINLPRARNRGAAAATAPWLCFYDADIILSSRFVEQVLPTLQDKHFYLAEPVKRGLTGTVVCPRADFLRCGGYDEIYTGWGEEDYDLYDSLVFHGLTQASFPENLATQIPHDDDVRIQHHLVKSIYVSQTANQLFRFAKFDLMRLMNRELTEDERRNLYQEAQECVRLAFENEQESQWRISYRTVRTLRGQDIVSMLVYQINPLQE